MTTTEKLRPRKRKKWRGLFVLLALFAIDQVWVQWDRRITVGHDTTRITSPIVGGYPDYLAAMNERHRQGVTAANNAAPRIFAIVGLADAPEPWWRAVYAAWEIAEPVGKPAFTGYANWMKNQGEKPPAVEQLASWEDPFDGDLENVARGPWRAEEHVRLAQWLTEMTPALAAFDEASRLPKYYFPLVLPDGRVSAAGETGTIPVLTNLGGVRQLAKAAMLRAMLRLQAGDAVGFQQDVLLCLRVARLVAQQPTAIEHMVALAIDNLAMQSVQRAAAHALDGPAVERLRQVLVSVGPMPTLAHAMDEDDRYLALGVTLYLRKVRDDKYWGFGVLPTNYDAVLRQVNAVFDRTVGAYNLPTAPARRAALADLQAEVDAKFDKAGTLYRVTHLEYIFLAIAFGSVPKTENQQTLNLVERDLALTALALRQAKARDGVFPPILAELNVAGFIVPPDRFNEKPLGYARKGDGYVLYSVGADLEDNGGEPMPKASHGKKWDVAARAEK